MSTRHCEERSDEAIHSSFFALRDGLLRFARNDGLQAVIARLTKEMDCRVKPGNDKFRLRHLLQRPLQHFEPVLAPKNLARRQHEAWRAEYARGHRLLGVLLVQRVEFGIRWAAGAQRRGVETGSPGG